MPLSRASCDLFLGYEIRCHDQQLERKSDKPSSRRRTPGAEFRLFPSPPNTLPGLHKASANGKLSNVQLPGSRNVSAKPPRISDTGLFSMFFKTCASSASCKRNFRTHLILGSRNSSSHGFPNDEIAWWCRRCESQEPIRLCLYVIWV